MVDVPIGQEVRWSLWEIAGVRGSSWKGVYMCK